MRTLNPLNRSGYAVVNMILSPNPRPSILFVKKRASPNDPWSFDVGFPGGMVKGGEGLLSALLRETEEETGIPPSMIEVMALVGLDTPTIMPRVTVYAYLSLFMGDRNALRPDFSEVSEAFWAPIDEIRGPGRMYHPYKKRYIEAYIYSHHVIWGVSKRILEASLPLLRALRLGGGNG